MRRCRGWRITRTAAGPCTRLSGFLLRWIAGTWLTFVLRGCEVFLDGFFESFRGVAGVGRDGQEGGEFSGLLSAPGMYFGSFLCFRAAFFEDGSAGDGRVYLEGVSGGVVLGDEYSVPVFQGGGYQFVDGLGELVVSAAGLADGDLEAERRGFVHESVLVRAALAGRGSDLPGGC